MKKYFGLFLVLFLVSRFFLLSNYPHFYDSPEYYRESLSTSILQSIAGSHESVHPPYLLLTQIFQRIAISLTGQAQVWVLSLISAIFGLMSFSAFYLLIKRLFEDKIALFSLLPLIFFSHLWLIHTNVLHEAVDQGLFLLGLLFFDLFLEKRKNYWLISVILSWGLAIFNFIGIIIWFPAVIGLVIYRSKKRQTWKDLGIFLGSALLSFGLAVSWLYGTLSLAISGPGERIQILLFAYGGSGLFSGWTLLNILRMLRNDFLILFHGYSIAVILGGLITLVLLIREKKYKILFLVFCFLLPFLFTGKFWYGGLFGRYSALVAYPLALLLALVPWKKIYWLMISILIFSFVPTFWAFQQTPIPEIQASLIDQSGISDEDLLILSDYQRPQLPYPNALYISSNGKYLKVIEEKINKRLSEGGRVFISQQAITFPYWQYDGQQIHIISKGDKNKAQLKKILETRRLELIAEDKNRPLLSIYRAR